MRVGTAIAETGKGIFTVVWFTLGGVAFCVVVAAGFLVLRIVFHLLAALI